MMFTTSDQTTLKAAGTAAGPVADASELFSPALIPGRLLQAAADARLGR